jgi:hypothetical protein
MSVPTDWLRLETSTGLGTVRKSPQNEGYGPRTTNADRRHVIRFVMPATRAKIGRSHVTRPTGVAGVSAAFVDAGTFGAFALTGTLLARFWKRAVTVNIETDRNRWKRTETEKMLGSDVVLYCQ